MACPLKTQQDLAVQHFINSLRDLEMQNVLKLTSVKVNSSAIVYALEVWASPVSLTQRSTQYLKQSPIQTLMMKQIESFKREVCSWREIRSGINVKIQSWSCGKNVNIHRNCPMCDDGINKIPETKKSYLCV